MTAMMVSAAISSGRVRLVSIRQQSLDVARLRVLWLAMMFAMVAIVAILRIVQIGMGGSGTQVTTLSEALLPDRGEITDRNGAEALRGTELTAPRSALPPLQDGEYYHADLIGLIATSEAGDALGTVVAVENFGAGDILDIAKPDGKRFMVPMTDAAVPEWDAERVVIQEGWFD